MTKQLAIKKDEAHPAPISFEDVESYLKILHESPDNKSIKKNSQAGGALYVPVGVMEMKLDEITGGLWSTQNEKTQVIANELLYSLELSFFHPVAKTWINRLGCAAVPIQQSKGASVLDLDSKIKNALVKNYPAVKAQAFKNAAQSIGRAFGRDLNREINIEYNVFSDKVKASGIIQKAQSIDELLKLWKENPEWHSNSGVTRLFADKKRELQKQS